MYKHQFLTVLLLMSLTFVPAYAEVTNLQTDRSLYSVDMTIYFSGTVDKADSQKLINLMIQDPDGKIVLMTGKYADSSGAFQIEVNTNDQSQFYLKGTYSASAFVNSKQDGKTVFFDFSPDGSPVNHSLQSSNATILAQIETNNASKNETNSSLGKSTVENLKLMDHVTISKNTPLISNTPIMTKPSSSTLTVIVYPLMAVCGAGIVVFIMYQRKKRAQRISEQSGETPLLKTESDQDYAMMILKNRLAKGEITLEEFKIMRDVLGEP